MQSNSHPQLNDFSLLSIFPHVHTSLTVQPLEYESQEVFEDQFQKILEIIFLLWPKVMPQVFTFVSKLPLSQEVQKVAHHNHHFQFKLGTIMTLATYAQCVLCPEQTHEFVRSTHMLQIVCTDPRIFSKFACQMVKHLTVKKLLQTSSLRQLI